MHYICRYIATSGSTRRSFREGGGGMSKAEAQLERRNGGEGGVNKKKKSAMWILPVIRFGDLRRLGPGFGVGVGCGVGVGVGLFGGGGLGTGFPGLQIGIGAGAGCGVGLGFGYAMGKGITLDDNGKYSNVGKLFEGKDIPYRSEIDSLVDGTIVSSKKLVAATYKQIEKWS